MNVLTSILSFLKNKYFIAFAIFVFMLFFGENDVMLQWHRHQELKALKESNAFYEKEVAQLQKALTEIEKDSTALQKYAREKLFMKKNNEDVFIVDEHPVVREE